MLLKIDPSATSFWPAADRAFQILLAHLDRRRAFALALDRLLVGPHIAGARHIAEVELSRIGEQGVDHQETKRLPLQATQTNRERATEKSGHMIQGRVAATDGPVEACPCEGGGRATTVYRRRSFKSAS